MRKPRAKYMWSDSFMSSIMMWMLHQPDTRAFLQKASLWSPRPIGDGPAER
ncbi:hypothetical protein FOPG_05463 [Fusarium oxysporum f. sp. conglutinans race 2 54008]|uniref:Uncharacterized protein n=4 Tax=Fusarium oxysporum species complex TaxID=171631 RepID=X0MJB5_FUSOX|nr:uncharacterized protein FOIG_06546 [Fusarium odoratissimum NRRL 54006]EXL81099.1 hypothetical protein FOPG_05463 [Fusarium oxysporum f. sp. conglutinans race 2 54008]EXM02279.1 hypothetical protein FOIG_06546 [Fusarium odoratissimum NRRL 54006]EXM33491.1 hypothetical protein FOTG_02133 [Fusarium oxysporum f. sp. vasinfectum 25433]TXC07799.1 hypothetical protein FocTR4_00003933 [Fusarium oxysporum f. sp. cubense]